MPKTGVFTYISGTYLLTTMSFFQKTISDNELIDGILSNKGQRRLFENRLYEKYAFLIRQGVWKHRLSYDECSMVYSDTILTIIENIENGSFKGHSSLKTYLNTIFSNKCVDLIRKNSTIRQQVHRGDTLDDYINILPDNSRTIVQTLMDEYDMQVLYRRIHQLGEKCQQMIKAWGEGFMDQEIALKMGYQSAAVVKTSRLRCLDKLRAMYDQEEKKGGGENN